MASIGKAGKGVSLCSILKIMLQFLALTNVLNLLYDLSRFSKLIKSERTGDFNFHISSVPNVSSNKRGHLVKLRTSLIVSLQNIISRSLGGRMKTNDIKVLAEDRVTPLLEYNDDLALTGKVSKEAIDSLTRQIKTIEGAAEKKVGLSKPYQHLLSMPGVGRILALTIMLETGPIGRFQEVGNYASYCRKVPTTWTSNDKKKGKGNKKNGNKYLAWAYSEAAELARRFDDNARTYFDRKRRRTNAPIAHSALAHKLSRAAYYIMRDGVPFMAEKTFG